MGLIESSQAPKKINMNEWKSSMNDGRYLSIRMRSNRTRTMMKMV
jgi:hypothetical protein